ncbi:molecular chaperone [Moellerella wisconsensis]|uniref:fimbrial biogenesis chaperone n=1 Tax=Moellerella wisconsensis TaxID=158849 RepID=UPI001F4D3B28|nr:molecular chaperone [Moellerella wisconsensis]UNH25542.1 molecular chaperone [Moellerella wisconsensis]
MKISLIILLFISFNSVAGITVSGTRFIYSENDNELSLSIDNLSSETLYLVQSWIEDDKNVKTTQFILTPPLFKSYPNSKNKVRIIKLSQQLPQDKEMLFWLHVKSLPAYDDIGQNNLHIIVKSSFKLIYRPSHLNEIAVNAAEKILFSLKGNQLTAYNPTAVYITFRDLYINQQEIMTPGMLSPFSQKIWTIENQPKAILSWSALNDYGGKTPEQTQTIINDMT